MRTASILALALALAACEPVINNDTILVAATLRVSVGSTGQEAFGECYEPSVSADGRFIAFVSAASNLVPGDTNNSPDVFVHDRATGLTERVSVDDNEVEAIGASFAPDISADGNFVAFESAADLVADLYLPHDDNGYNDIYLRDRAAGTTLRVSLTDPGLESGGFSRRPSISDDGQVIAFECDEVGSLMDPSIVDATAGMDVFVRDLSGGGSTELISRREGFASSGNGEAFSPTISADGQRVAFESDASDLAAPDADTFKDVFLRIRGGSPSTSLVSLRDAGGDSGNNASFGARLSADGLHVAFLSMASDLVPAGVDGNGSTTDVFVRDLAAPADTFLASLTHSGGPGSGECYQADISADGRMVVFQSGAANFVPDDDNGAPDVYLHDRDKGLTTRLSIRTFGGEGNGDSAEVCISGDGKWGAFQSYASNLDDEDTNGQPDIFLRGPLR